MAFVVVKKCSQILYSSFQEVGLGCALTNIFNEENTAEGTVFDLQDKKTLWFSLVLPLQ